MPYSILHPTFTPQNSFSKDRCRAQMDRAISMICALRPTFIKSTPGVNFIQVGCMEQIIEIALSIFALCLCLTFRGAFYWRKSSVQGHKKVYDTDPWMHSLTSAWSINMFFLETIVAFFFIYYDNIYANLAIRVLP